jgi:hypothetical protein
MKYFVVAIMTLLMMSSCFSTKSDNEEARLRQKILDSLHADSVELRRSTPDTAVVAFKRSTICDEKQQITFDRVKMLSGEEAAEYAIRHKRFGNNVNVVVNQEVTLETIPLAPDAKVYLYQANADSTDSKYVLRECSHENVEDLPRDQVIEIIILHSKIIYLKQVDYEKKM